MLTVRQLHQLGRARLGKPRRVSRKAIRRFRVGVVLHRSESFLWARPRRSPTNQRRRSAGTPGGRCRDLSSAVLLSGGRRTHRVAPSAHSGQLSRGGTTLVLDPILASTSYEVKVRQLTAPRR